MAAFDFDIDGLKFPDDSDLTTTTEHRTLQRMLSPFKPKFKPASYDPSIPKGYMASDYKVFLILRDVLQPDSAVSLFDAVDRIIEIFSIREYDIRSVNTVCFELAEQIPYIHPSHIKLASVLWLVGRSYKRIEICSTKKELGNIHMFYQHLWEDIADNRFAPGNHGLEPTRYVNYQAFLAHLAGLGVFFPRPLDAIDAMRDAFEENRDNESIAIREAWVMGAAQWILWNGQGLLNQLLWPGDAYDSHSLEKSHEKEGNKQGLTIRRWRTWKDNFRMVVSNSTFREECRAVSRKAADIMDVLEQGMIF